MDKTVNLPSLSATDAQIAEISRCITNLALIAGVVVVALKADGMKLWLLSLLAFVVMMAHEALKD